MATLEEARLHVVYAAEYIDLYPTNDLLYNTFRYAVECFAKFTDKTLKDEQIYRILTTYVVMRDTLIQKAWVPNVEFALRPTVDVLWYDTSAALKMWQFNGFE